MPVSLMKVGIGVLLGFVACLGILHALTQFLPHEIFSSTDRYLDRVFDLNQEQNVPAWYASILWFMVFQVSLLNYIYEWKTGSTRRFRWVWLLFAIMFLVASVDETATIHEHIGSYLQDNVVPSIRDGIGAYLIRHGWSGTSSLVSFATSRSPWVLFYAPFLIGIGGFCWLFLWRRLYPRRKLQWLMLAAAGCYLVAEAFDYFQGVRAIPITVIQKPMGMDWASFLDLSVFLEELLEDLGTIFIIVALFDHLRLECRENFKLVAHEK